MGPAHVKTTCVVDWSNSTLSACPELPLWWFCWFCSFYRTISLLSSIAFRIFSNYYSGRPLSPAYPVILMWICMNQSLFCLQTLAWIEQYNTNSFHRLISVALSHLLVHEDLKWSLHSFATPKLVEWKIFPGFYYRIIFKGFITAKERQCVDSNCLYEAKIITSLGCLLYTSPSPRDA